MIKTISASLLMVATLVAASSSFADEKGGLYVEPMVTYQGSSETHLNWPAPFSNSTGSVQGLGLGARLGFHIDETFFVAADARYSKPTFKDSSNNISADANEYNYGLVAGIQAPVWGLRVWGGWIADGQLDPKEDNNVDLKFTGGNGYRVGAGIHVSIVSINLEYQNMKYNTTTVQKIGNIATNAQFDDLKNESYILSVSFPLEL